jgi:cytochrome c oxidase subunit II
MAVGLVAGVGLLAGCGSTKAAVLTPEQTRGRAAARTHGCLTCHTTTGKPGMGPTWKGVFGRTVTLDGGITVTADETYLRTAIVDPAAQKVIGSSTVMPKVTLTDREVSDLLAYIESLK